MKHSIHLAAIALLTTLLVTSCDTFSAPADPDKKNTEQVKDISGHVATHHSEPQQ